MPTTLRRRVLAVLATLRGKSLVSRVASAKLPTEDGAFDIHVYESLADGATHVALVKGELGSGENVLARVHSSCLTGDVFHSARCDCGAHADGHVGSGRFGHVAEDREVLRDRASGKSHYAR